MVAQIAPATRLAIPTDDQVAEQPDSNLTSKQAAFVQHFVSGKETAGDHIRSAEQAGYASDAARFIGWQLLDRPNVQRAITEKIRRELRGPIAVNCIKRLREWSKNPELATNAGAKVVFGALGLAGFVAPKDAISTTAKQLSEMTADELHRIVREAEDQLAASAKDVSPHAPDAQEKAQASDTTAG